MVYFSSTAASVDPPGVKLQAIWRKLSSLETEGASLNSQSSYREYPTFSQEANEEGEKLLGGGVEGVGVNG